MEIIALIVILVMSIVIHEVAHGYSAYAQGDLTAAVQGRLTLNPISHLDFIGSILLPGLLLISGAPFLLGWAKPVPFNPYNLYNQKWGPMLVAIAGPLSNIALAVIFALGLRFVPSLSDPAIGLMGFVVLINLVLAIFNMIPIPPLDGSKVLFAFLPAHMQGYQRTLERYGLIFVILFLVVFWGVFENVIVGAFTVLVGESAPRVFALLMQILG